MYSYVPGMVRTCPFWYIKPRSRYILSFLYIDVHTRTYFRLKVYTGIYHDLGPSYTIASYKYP